MLFASTTISNGSCVAVVTSTGMATEIGAIQELNGMGTSGWHGGPKFAFTLPRKEEKDRKGMVLSFKSYNWDWPRTQEPKNLNFCHSKTKQDISSPQDAVQSAADDEDWDMCCKCVQICANHECWESRQEQTPLQQKLDDFGNLLAKAYRAHHCAPTVSCSFCSWTLDVWSQLGWHQTWEVIFAICALAAASSLQPPAMGCYRNF